MPFQAQLQFRLPDGGRWLCVCQAVCADKEVACPDWASKGECEKNPASMLSLCPQSCGTVRASGDRTGASAAVLASCLP